MKILFVSLLLFFSLKNLYAIKPFLTSHEKKVILQAKMILNLNKLLKAVIKNRDYSVFEAIVNELNTFPELYDFSKKERENYKQLLQAELKKLKALCPWSSAKWLKITFGGSIVFMSLYLTLLSIWYWYNDYVYVSNDLNYYVLRISMICSPLVGLSFMKLVYDIYQGRAGELDRLELIRALFMNYEKNYSAKKEIK